MFKCICCMMPGYSDCFLASLSDITCVWVSVRKKDVWQNVWSRHKQQKYIQHKKQPKTKCSFYTFKASMLSAISFNLPFEGRGYSILYAMIKGCRHFVLRPHLRLQCFNVATSFFFFFWVPSSDHQWIPLMVMMMLEVVKKMTMMLFDVKMIIMNFLVIKEIPFATN